MQDIPAVTQANLVRNLAGMSDIHSRIKQLRESRALSMEQLAERVGVSWQTIQQWENGKTAPKRKRLESVADALGATTQFLVLGQDGDESTQDPWPFSFPRADFELLRDEDKTELEQTLITLIAGKLASYEIEKQAQQTSAPLAIGSEGRGDKMASLHEAIAGAKRLKEAAAHGRSKKARRGDS